MIREWTDEWNRDKRFRQTKIWFPGPDEKKTRRMMKFGRCKLGTLVQWVTGFCSLMKHRHNKTPHIDPTCRRCGEAEETPSHLTCECPALTEARSDCFLLREMLVHNPLETKEKNLKWTPDGLYKFIVDSKAELLLVDEDSYE